MFDTICNVIVGLIIILITVGAVFVFTCLGYSIYEYSTAPYIISADGDDYPIAEYKEENGYYYATTIYGDECKIPVWNAVVKENK